MNENHFNIPNNNQNVQPNLNHSNPSQNLVSQPVQFNQNVSNFNDYNSKPPKKKKTMYILIILLSTIIVALVIALFINGLSPKDDSSNKQEENSSENPTTTEAEIEYNKKIDEEYLNTLKFEILDIVKVDENHSGYSSFGKDVTRVIFYIKNGLRLSHTNGYNGYWDYDLKIITDNNIENEGGLIYPIDDTNDAIFITYYTGDLNLTSNNFKKMRIKDFYNFDLNFGKKLQQFNNSQEILENKITELSTNHYIFVIGKNEYSKSDDNGCNAYNFYAMIEWGKSYKSLIDSQFEIVSSQTLQATQENSIKLEKYLLKTTDYIDLLSTNMDAFLETKGLAKNENYKNTYLKEIVFSTYIPNSESNNQSCYDAELKLKQYGLQYTENNKSYYFK